MYSVISGGIWLKLKNSSKLLRMSSLPARMKKTQPQIKALDLEWQQHFFHYKSMGIFSDAKGQLTPQSVVESG